MLEKIKHNLVLKILAIFFSVVLWIVVYNINNPMETRNIEVDIVFLNESSLASHNLRITNDYSRQVTVQIRGRRSQLDQILTRDFRAVANFANITHENVESIPIDNVQYLGNKNIQYEFQQDKYIDLNVERIITGDFPITIETTGEPEEGYHVVSISITPENYSVKDVGGLVSQVSHATVRLDIEGIRGNRARRVYTEVYDEEGNLINQLSNSFIVDVNIEVAKEVEIQHILTGSLPSGYITVSATTYPDYVFISGPADELSRINSIRTESISLSGRTEAFTESVRLLDIPQNSRIIGRSEMVNVSIVVEELEERTFLYYHDEVEKRYADTSGNYSYIIEDETISFTIKGRKLYVDDLHKEDLAPYIDVSGIIDGERILPVRINLPENTQQMNYPTVQVIVYRNMGIPMDTSRITINNMRTSLYQYQVEEEEVVINVQGFSEDLQNIEAHPFSPRINVGSLEEGTYDVPIEINLPSGVQAMDQNTVRITVMSR